MGEGQLCFNRESNRPGPSLYHRSLTLVQIQQKGQYVANFLHILIVGTICNDRENFSFLCTECTGGSVIPFLCENTTQTLKC